MILSIRRAALVAGTVILSTSLLAQPQFFPNSQKYRDSSISNATGRAGTASIEAQALLNRNGTADVAVTAAAPGTLSRVQVDFPSGATQNFNGLSGGGTFATNVRGLAARSTVGIQAHVQDVDGARTDIVSVDEIVKRRPDLTVSNLSAPSSGYAGATTIIRATIRELNGDVGARADCRLLVDDVAVDRAEGIWVDANDSVDCTFAHSFYSVGPAKLTVVVDGVTPGDWDESNNSASVQIEVQRPPESFQWDASVYEEEEDKYLYEQYTWGEFYTDNQGINQGFDFRGIIREDFAHTGLKVSVKASTQGGQLYSGVTTQFWGPFERWDGRCSWSETYQPEVIVCWDNDWNYTTVDISFGSSEVVYRSWGWATKRSPWSPTEPRFEWNRTYTADTIEHRFGETVTMDVTFEAAGRTWAAQPEIPLRPTETWQWIQPYRCVYDDFLNENFCHEVNWTRKTRRGSASGF